MKLTSHYENLAQEQNFLDGRWQKYISNVKYDMLLSEQILMWFCFGNRLWLELRDSKSLSVLKFRAALEDCLQLIQITPAASPPSVYYLEAIAHCFSCPLTRILLGLCLPKLLSPFVTDTNFRWQKQQIGSASQQHGTVRLLLPVLVICSTWVSSKYTAERGRLGEDMNSGSGTQSFQGQAGLLSELELGSFLCE